MGCEKTCRTLPPDPLKNKAFERVLKEVARGGGSAGIHRDHSPGAGNMVGGVDTGPHVGEDTGIKLNWLEREISSASAEVATWPAWRRDAMRREVARGGTGVAIEGYGG